MQRVITLLIVLALLVMVGFSETSEIPVLNETQAEIDFEKDNAFQSEVLPIIEGSISKEYPRIVKFNEDATLYFDRNQVVFLIDKENSKTNNIKKELQEKLGEKVKFKKSQA